MEVIKCEKCDTLHYEGAICPGCNPMNVSSDKCSIKILKKCIGCGKEINAIGLCVECNYIIRSHQMFDKVDDLLYEVIKMVKENYAYFRKDKERVKAKIREAEKEIEYLLR